MNSIWSKFLVIAVIFIAEALYVFSEIISAKYYSQPESQFFHIIGKILIITIVGSILILTGYMLGFRAFKNIWIVSVISITSILIIEPILAYLIFKQLPTKGAGIGLILGALGFAATLFIK
jgi:Na+-driven multidrug efflux pump